MEDIQRPFKRSPRWRLKPRMQLLDRARMTVWWFIFAKPTADMPFSWQAPTSRPLLRKSRGCPSTSASSTAISADLGQSCEQTFASDPTPSSQPNTIVRSDHLVLPQPHVGIIREPVYLWANQKRISERLEQQAGGGLNSGKPSAGICRLPLNGGCRTSVGRVQPGWTRVQISPGQSKRRRFT